MEYINIQSSKRTEFIDITAEVQAFIDNNNIKNGLCFVFVPHTTAAITINEGADPAVTRDILAHLAKMVPYHGDYQHSEGNSDSHIKSSLIGASELILVKQGRLILGTWQSIYFCEFDGPRSRRIGIQFPNS